MFDTWLRTNEGEAGRDVVFRWRPGSPDRFEAVALVGGVTYALGYGETMESAEDWLRYRMFGGNKPL